MSDQFLKKLLQQYAEMQKLQRSTSIFTYSSDEESLFKEAQAAPAPVGAPPPTGQQQGQQAKPAPGANVPFDPEKAKAELVQAYGKDVVEQHIMPSVGGVLTKVVVGILLTAAAVSTLKMVIGLVASLPAKAAKWAISTTIKLIVRGGPQMVTKIADLAKSAGQKAAQVASRAGAAAGEAGAAEGGAAAAGEAAAAAEAATPGIFALEGGAAAAGEAAAAGGLAVGAGTVFLVGLAALAGLGIGYLAHLGIDHLLAKWVDKKTEKSVRDLSSDIALRIVNLWKANKLPPPDAATMQKLIEQYREIRNSLGAKAAPQGAGQAAPPAGFAAPAPTNASSYLDVLYKQAADDFALREQALQELAKRNNIQYFPPTEKQRAREQHMSNAPGGVQHQFQGQPTAPGMPSPPQGAGQPQKGQSAAAQQHVVQQGESLSTIAKHYYGDFSHWPTIYNANKDKIKDPDHIEVGWHLVIPPKGQGSNQAPAPAPHQQKKNKQPAPAPQPTPAPAPTPQPTPAHAPEKATPGTEPGKLTDTTEKAQQQQSVNTSPQYRARENYLKDQHQAVKTDSKLLAKDPANPEVSDRYLGRLQEYEKQGDIQMYVQALKSIPEGVDNFNDKVKPVNFLVNFYKNRLNAYTASRESYKQYYKQLNLDMQWLHEFVNVLQEKGIDTGKAQSQASQLLRALEIYKGSGGQAHLKQCFDQAVKEGF